MVLHLFYLNNLRVIFQRYVSRVAQLFSSLVQCNYFNSVNWVGI